MRLVLPTALRAIAALSAAAHEPASRQARLIPLVPPEAAVVQVHGVGPFHIHWRAGDTWRDGLKTLDSPDAASVFRFKKGDRVVTPRGPGRIRQGYDSGEVLAYEIDGDDGTLFMAVEKDVKRAAPAAP